MELFFANNLDLNPRKSKLTGNLNRPDNLTRQPSMKRKKTNKRNIAIVFIEQLINSSIVAGIASFSVWAAEQSVGWEPPVIAFGITFLTELRKYRKL